MTFAVIAASMHVAAFLLYKRNMGKGMATPNPATWMLWVILTTLNCATYLTSTSDIIKSALPIASSLANIYVFVVALRLGKFRPLDQLEKVILLLGSLIGLLWLLFHDAKMANLLVQIPIALSFYPTYRGVWRDPKTETRVFPWYLWSIAYLVSLIAIFLQWEHDPRPDDGLYQLAYPILCFILHGGVGLLAQRHPKKSL
ncbi:MAG: hypothetical protein WCV85_01205 [Patescibacteria group bacterium]|jgi:hypothetical protein